MTIVYVKLRVQDMYMFTSWSNLGRVSKKDIKLRLIFEDQETIDADHFGCLI